MPAKGSKTSVSIYLLPGRTWTTWILAGQHIIISASLILTARKRLLLILCSTWGGSDVTISLLESRCQLSNQAIKRHFLGTEAASQCEILSNKTYEEDHSVSLLLCEEDLPVTPACVQVAPYDCRERKYRESMLTVSPLTLYRSLYFTDPSLPV